MAKGKKTMWAEVTCHVHGVKDSERNWAPPQVKVTPPNHKRSRQGGCPICKKSNPFT